MELTIEELKELIPFKFELIRPVKKLKLSELPINTYFWETENGAFDGFTGYFNGFNTTMQENQVFILLGKNCFTWRDKSCLEHLYHCPAIYRQLSGKNKGRIFHFSFYDAWKKYCDTKKDIQNSIKNDGRWFLPCYLPNYTK